MSKEIRKSEFVSAAERIEDKILSGTFANEETLPTALEISRALKIPLSSAKKSVQVLLDEGVVYEKQGEGMFISAGAADIIRKKRKYEEETAVNDMNEKKEISAKDLYVWHKGEDDYGIEVLSALNTIIGGLKELGECDEWEDIAGRVDWHCSNISIGEICDKIYSKDELFDMADNFAAVRIMLFGDKIDYGKLLEMLKNNVDEFGWTKDKAEKRKKEREEKRRERDGGSSPVGMGD